MVEVEVSRFEYAHHLKSHSRFAVKRNGGLKDQQRGYALHRDVVNRQVTILGQRVQAIE